MRKLIKLELYKIFTKPRTYIGFAKSEDIQNNIVQMEKAMKQMEKDILNKKKFKNGKVE
jgi:hypothetical protein